MEVISDCRCFIRYETESWLSKSGSDEGYVTNIFGSILHAVDDDDDDGTLCGHIRVCHLRCSEMLANDEFDPRKWARMESDELAEIAKSIYRAGGGWSKDFEAMFGDVARRDMLVISEVELHPEFRGRGIGLQAVSRTIDLFGGACGVAALCPWPTELEDRKDEQEARRAHAKLAKYSERIGFSQLADKDVWVRSLVGGPRRTGS